MMPRKQKTIDDKIDDLAVIVNRGFSDVYKRFDDIDTRFDDIENRMGTKEDLKQFATKQEMADGFAHVNAQLDRIVDDVSDLPAIREELYALDRRVTRLEHARKA